MEYIYSITNLEDNTTYVGTTTKSNPYVEWKDIITESRSSNKNLILLRDIRKYGVNKFKFRVLEECRTDIISIKKNNWKVKLNAHDTKTKIKKEISCFTLNDEWIRDYESVEDALIGLNIKYGKGKIIECISGLRFDAFGYRWAKKNNKPKFKEKRKHEKGLIYGINPTLNIKKIWKSQADAAEDIVGNRKQNLIIFKSLNSPNNNKKQAKGWYLFRSKPKSWNPISRIQSSEYYSKAGLLSAEKSRVPIYGIDIETGDILHFKSISEASFHIKGKGNYDAAGNIRNNITRIMNGEFWCHAYGYKWYITTYQ